MTRVGICNITRSSKEAVLRYVRYREGAGRPDSIARENLNELLMLTEAAVSLTNVQRWSQERVAEEALSARAREGGSIVIPQSLRNASKNTQYETEVVDNFLQISTQSFAYHGSEALWERPIRTGERGRPASIDVALFNAEKEQESRIEFGRYSRSKLRQDSKKLWDIASEARDDVPGLMIANFLILWDDIGGRSSKAGAGSWFDECTKATGSSAPDGAAILVRAASHQDLFSPVGGQGRLLRAAIFELVDRRS